MLSYVSNPKITEINLLKFYKLTTEHYKRGGTTIDRTTKNNIYSCLEQLNCIGSAIISELYNKDY